MSKIRGLKADSITFDECSKHGVVLWWTLVKNALPEVSVSADGTWCGSERVLCYAEHTLLGTVLEKYIVIAECGFTVDQVLQWCDKEGVRHNVVAWMPLPEMP